MGAIIQCDSGGEKFIPWAKKKLGMWHVGMMRTGLRTLFRYVVATDGTEIFFNSFMLGHGQFRDKIRIKKAGGFWLSSRRARAQVDTIAISAQGAVLFPSFIMPTQLETVSASGKNVIGVGGQIYKIDGTHIADISGSSFFLDDVGSGFITDDGVTGLNRFKDDGTPNGAYALSVSAYVIETRFAFRIKNVFFIVNLDFDPTLYGYDLTSGLQVSSLNLVAYPNLCPCGNAAYLYAPQINADGTGGIVDEFTLAGVATTRQAILPALPAATAAVVAGATCDDTTMLVHVVDNIDPSLFRLWSIDLQALVVTNITSAIPILTNLFPSANVKKA